MCIPIGAENPVDAITYMDYVYQPEIQARDRDVRNYICPVPSAADGHRPIARQEPADLPDRRRSGEDPHVLRLQDPGRAEPVERAVPTDLPGLDRRASREGSSERAVGRRHRQGGHAAHRAAEAQPEQEAGALRAARARHAVPGDLLPHPDRLHVLHIAAVRGSSGTSTSTGTSRTIRTRSSSTAASTSGPCTTPDWSTLLALSSPIRSPTGSRSTVANASPCSCSCCSCRSSSRSSSGPSNGSSCFATTADPRAAEAARVLAQNYHVLAPASR